MNKKTLVQSKRSFVSTLSKLPDWLFRLCTGSSVYDELNEEHYRQRILVMISCFWLLSSVFFSVLTPLLIKLDFRGQMVAQALFLSTIFGVVISMLVLRFSGNRITALNVMLLIYTSAFTDRVPYLWRLTIPHLSTSHTGTGDSCHRWQHCPERMLGITCRNHLGGRIYNGE